MGKKSRSSEASQRVSMKCARLLSGSSVGTNSSSSLLRVDCLLLSGRKKSSPNIVLKETKFNRSKTALKRIAFRVD